jgi:hypothetical protein
MLVGHVGNDHPEYAIAVNSFGECLRRCEYFDGALKLFQSGTKTVDDLRDENLSQRALMKISMT